MSGDDFAALLAALAGVLLLALGAASLWRSRRRDGSRTRRYARRALVGVAGLIVAYLAILPIGLAIVVTHKARSPVHAAELGGPYQRVSFTISDGLGLAGWYVPSRNRAAVIVFPGPAAGPVAHARLLVAHGYGVLLIDRRGDGVLNRVYYAAARIPKTLWEVPQGGHTHALSALPREYERRVMAFFDQALLGGSSAGRYCKTPIPHPTSGTEQHVL
jgi:hypothetical protein